MDRLYFCTCDHDSGQHVEYGACDVAGCTCTRYELACSAAEHPELGLPVGDVRPEPRFRLALKRVASFSVLRDYLQRDRTKDRLYRRRSPR